MTGLTTHLRVRERLVVALGLLAALTLASCGTYGDKGRPIEFVNHTGQEIALWQDSRAYPATRKDLAADARYKSVWVDSRLSERDKDVVKFRVEATADSGALVFCHEYTWNEFVRAGWVVEIRVLNDCPPS